ncbi:MAG: hypothetical protein V4576_03510 [Patescibacteria group bacterium]
MQQNEYFTEKIATLPEGLQEAILASGWEKALSDMQKEFKLHIDQGQVLENLAQQLMFGDIDAPDFVSGMFNEAHISSAVAGDILVEIDERILRNIRGHMEEQEAIADRDEEERNLLLDDEELAEKELSDTYANYYKETANILADSYAQLDAEGILEDGSNIPDEKLAKALGMTVEEMKNKRLAAAQDEAQKFAAKQSFTPDLDAQKEKEEMLREIESPEKTPLKPLFTQPKPEPVVQERKPEVIIPPDHQLQNTHIETPYDEEDIVEIHEAPVIEIRRAAPTPAPEPTGPVIKKPTKITLSIDPYKEPIE